METKVEGPDRLAILGLSEAALEDLGLPPAEIPKLAVAAARASTLELHPDRAGDSPDAAKMYQIVSGILEDLGAKADPESVASRVEELIAGESFRVVMDNLQQATAEAQLEAQNLRGDILEGFSALSNPGTYTPLTLRQVRVTLIDEPKALSYGVLVGKDEDPDELWQNAITAQDEAKEMHSDSPEMLEELHEQIALLERYADRACRGDFGLVLEIDSEGAVEVKKGEQSFPEDERIVGALNLGSDEPSRTLRDYLELHDLSDFGAESILEPPGPDPSEDEMIRSLGAFVNMNEYTLSGLDTLPPGLSPEIAEGSFLVAVRINSAGKREYRIVGRVESIEAV